MSEHTFGLLIWLGLASFASAVYFLTPKNRRSTALGWTGTAFLILCPAIPLCAMSLRNLGLLHGWDGFALFAFGILAMPPLAVIGVVSLVLAGVNKRRLAGNVK